MLRRCMQRLYGMCMNLIGGINGAGQASVQAEVSEGKVRDV